MSDPSWDGKDADLTETVRMWDAASGRALAMVGAGADVPAT
ncbi:hypothetical protein [Methylobacterium komagatae]